MDYPEFDAEKLKQEAQDAEDKKNIYGALGAVASGFDAVPSSYNLLYGKGQPTGNSAKIFENLQKTVSDPWEKQKKTYEMYKSAKEGQGLKDKSDPNSKSANAMRQVLVSKFGADPSAVANLTQEQMSQTFGDTGKMAEIQQQSKINFENEMAKQKASQGFQSSENSKNRANNLAEIKMREGVNRAEKDQALNTPYGLANTPDDAKQLKEAYESKKNFDSKIQEMIELRKSKGVEYLDREAVARGKQLSKDLLLEYKNMAKLGVLSAADEAIINAIIPEDPLGQDYAPGQDPILTKLTSFKSDNDKDFNTRIQTRTREGLANNQQAMPQNMAPAPQDKKIVRTQQNKRTGEIKVTYADGTSEIKKSSTAGM